MTRFARASLLQIFFAANQLLSFGCFDKTGLNKAWSQTQVATNQLIRSRSQNKVIAYESWFTGHTKKTACHICCACLTIWKVLKEAVIWFIYFLSDDFDKILYLFYCLMYYYLIMSQMILIHLSGFWWWNNLRSDLFVFLVVMLRFLKYLLTVWW